VILAPAPSLRSQELGIHEQLLAFAIFALAHRGVDADIPIAIDRPLIQTLRFAQLGMDKKRAPLM
jgi:hypothetical protein